MIPQNTTINTSNIIVNENHDKLINITNLNPRIVFKPYYYIENIPGATNKCFVRESVYKMLEKALIFLPEGYGFKIYDAWRPFAVQEFLYNTQVENLQKMKGLSLQKAKEEAKQFVSFPSKNVLEPFVHSTGGAVDLTVINQNAEELNMGTAFDDFTSLSNTDSFEQSENLEVKNNRRLLYNAMINVGFTNYPSEWWHYDYGNNFWAAVNGHKTSIFGGVYSITE